MGNINSCRSCGHAELERVLSLGQTPLANALLTADQLTQPEEVYPLDLVFCPQCTLVQITETVPAEKLFREYLYFSSFSDTLLCQAQELVEHLINSRELGRENLVIEIASNDGYLLQYYQRAGIHVLGIEPATNIARVARQRNIPTLCEFFSLETAERLKLEGKQADVLHANNVLAHVGDLNGVMRGFATILKPSGVAVIEVPYVKDMIDNCEFDTIYHEHLCYFSLTALDRLFRRHGMIIFDVELLPIHGGTLRLFARKVFGECSRPAVDRLLAEEVASGLDRVNFYLGFGARVENLRAELVKLLNELKMQGKRIAAYGASAKGSTLLNYFRIGRKTIDFVADRSTVKQGYYTPGTHIPIHPPERLVETQPDYVLLLTWNFANEILAQQEEYRQRGGQFIIPIPELKIV